MNRKDPQAPLKGGNKVVAVKTVTVGVESWSVDTFLPGDVLDQIKATGSTGLTSVTAPFTGGKSGLQKELRRLFHVPDVAVTVRRGGSAIDIQARVIVEEANLLKKQQYLLAAYHDPNYLCLLIDSTEEDCRAVQENTVLLMERASNVQSAMGREQLLNKLASTKLADSYAPYPWSSKMEAVSPAPGSPIVFSFLVMPHQPNKLTSYYLDVEDTSARSMAWLSAAQASGVPITFVNIQTEPFLLQGPGFKATGVSRQDPGETANAGIYSVQAYDGLEIDVVRAVRLWYVPSAAELAVDLRPEEGESLIGVDISRTDEGFCHISSIAEGTAADRAGLLPIFQASRLARKLLVVSRVGGMKVTPWMAVSSGAIRCFDTATITSKLQLHRQTGTPVRLHVMLWDGALSSGPAAVDDSTTSSKVPPPIVVESCKFDDSSNGELPRHFWFTSGSSSAQDEQFSASVDDIISRHRVVSESRRFTYGNRSHRFSDLDLGFSPAPGLSFRFEVPQGGSSFRESSLRTPLIGSGPSSPVFKSL